MAITSSAGDGVRVTSSAVTDSITAQTQANGIDEIVLTNTFAALNNGNVHGAADYSGDNRKIILRQGAIDEETRVITAQAAGTGTTVILTVNEAWDSQPVSGDAADVSYNLDDTTTLTGVTKGSKTGVYEFSRNFRIGSGAAFGYFAMMNGQGLEVDDDGNTRYTMIVQSQGRCDIGYEQGGEGIQGGFVFSIHNAAAELTFDVESGGIFRGYNWIFVSWLVITDQQILGGADVIVNGAQWKDTTSEIKMFDGNWTNMTISGKASGTTENIRIAEATIIDGWLVSATNGFTTAAADTTTETLTIKNVNFIGNATLITVNSNKTWNVINPTWVVDTTTQVDISFITATANLVNERYSLDAVVQTAAGVKRDGAVVMLYEGLRLDDLVIKELTDATGLAASSWIFTEYTDVGGGTSLGTVIDGNHALRVFDYTFTPFIATQASSTKFDGNVIMIPDGAISEQTQSTAISAGAGILPVRHAPGETDTRPMKVLNYDAGTGSAAADGETLTQGSATGDVVEALGDAVSGTIVLENWNGTEFTDNQPITGDVAFAATTDTAGFYQEYTWEVDCSDESLQTTYDYMAAKMADYSGSPLAFTPIFEQLHEWGKDLQSQAIYSGTGGFFTERSLNAGSPQAGEGVWLSNRGSGTIAYMTSDADVQFVPPASFTFSITGVKTNSEVRLYTTAKVEIDGVENTTGGVTKAAISSGGTGYTVSDVLTVQGGTGTAATLTVATVDGGVITGVTITNPGIYSANPTNPAGVTGGTGSGATFNLTISGLFSYTYVFSGDIDAYAVVFNLDFKEIRLIDLVISNADQTIPVQQQTDRVYSNP